MSEKFKVEFDRKDVELEFYDPTDDAAQTWMDYLNSMSSEKDKAYLGYETKEQKEAAPSEKVAEWMQLNRKVIGEKEKLIFGLHKNGILKTADYMRKISLRDKNKIVAWFDEAIGIKTTKTEQDFTKS